jgi:hypothetical protein
MGQRGRRICPARLTWYRAGVDARLILVVDEEAAVRVRRC